MCPVERSAGTTHGVAIVHDLQLACSAGKAMRYDKVQHLFQQLQRRGFRPNVYTYTSLIAACQRAGKWQEAWQAFEEMEAAGVLLRTPNRLLSSASNIADRLFWHIRQLFMQRGCRS